MKVRRWEGDGKVGLTYWCQGCEEMHSVIIERADAGRPCWGYNGNADAPTFTPSVLVTSGHYMPGHDPSKSCWCRPSPDGEDWGFKCRRCHTFIRNGMVEFLSDCTHALAGQTLPLPDLPDQH
ncbi:DUF6527 family protein [Phenylobacterium sp.]|uniref:DUF6527 family protein n=1 Tax=Phenylobacterium sp. TaxID=1871053 RepID=UPI003939F03B